MRRYTTIISVIALLSFMFSSLPEAVFASNLSKPVMKSQAAETILVKYKVGILDKTKETINNSLGAAKKDSIKPLEVDVLTVSPGKNAASLVKAYRNNPNVEFAEPDSEIKTTATPNDTYYSYEWAMPKISAPAGWDISTGSSSITVAVVDSGIDMTHPDLSGRIVPGYDFVNNDNDPSDDFGHGTAVAGIVGATGNNNLGVAGLNWSAKIMPIKVADSTGNGYVSNVSKGIIDATDRGAKVINLSIATSSDSLTLKNAVDYAFNKNVVLVAAAGNYSSNIPMYPAAYNNVIAVSALTGDQISTSSNYGNNIDVCAPGSSIYTTKLGGSYTYSSGTSVATPFVTGLAALILGINPSLKPNEIQDIIQVTATDLGNPGLDQYYGWGRINVEQALKSAGGSSPVEPITPDTTPPNIAIILPVDGSTLSGTTAVNVEATDNIGVKIVELYVDGSFISSSITSPYSISLDTAKLTNGAHSIQAKVYDAAGNSSASQIVSINVSNPSSSSSGNTKGKGSGKRK